MEEVLVLEYEKEVVVALIALIDYHLEILVEM